MIRDRAYTRQAGEALRLAHENKLTPLDPKEVIPAAKAEITETHVKAACEVARAWDHLGRSHNPPATEGSRSWIILRKNERAELFVRDFAMGKPRIRCRG